MYLGNVLYCRFSFMDLLDVQLIFERVLSRFQRYNSRTHFITKKNYKKLQVGTCIRAQALIILYIQVCTQAMYSYVASHLWIGLIFSSSSRGTFARFRRYTSRTHFITKKKLQKTAGRYIQQSTYINNFVHLGMYLGNVLYCRFSFIVSHDP